jgi:hypothetical protein
MPIIADDLQIRRKLYQRRHFEAIAELYGDTFKDLSNKSL